MCVLVHFELLMNSNLAKFAAMTAIDNTLSHNEVTKTIIRILN